MKKILLLLAIMAICFSSPAGAELQFAIGGKQDVRGVFKLPLNNMKENGAPSIVLGISPGEESPWKIEVTTSLSPWRFEEEEINIAATIYMVGGQVNYFLKNEDWYKLGPGLAFNQYLIKAEDFVTYGFNQVDLYLVVEFQPQKKWNLPFPEGLFLTLEAGYGITFGEIAGKNAKVGDFNANIGVGIKIGGGK